MGKIAFVFPGQGAQKVGMGKEFYEYSPIAKEIFDQAGEAVGLDLKALCFEENDDINITEFTQVALLTTSVAIMEVLRDKGRTHRTNFQSLLSFLTTFIIML